MHPINAACGYANAKVPRLVIQAFTYEGGVKSSIIYYTTGLLDNPFNLCYNDDSEGENFTDILTNKEVKTMNAILNKTAMAVLVCDDYQYEYDFSFSFEWQDESFSVLRTNTGTCSASPPRERR